MNPIDEVLLVDTVKPPESSSFPTGKTISITDLLSMLRRGEIELTADDIDFQDEFVMHYIQSFETRPQPTFYVIDSKCSSVVLKELTNFALNLYRYKRPDADVKMYKTLDTAQQKKFDEFKFSLIFLNSNRHEWIIKNHLFYSM